MQHRTPRAYLGAYLARYSYQPCKTLLATVEVLVGPPEGRDTESVALVFERRGEDINIRREDGLPMCAALRAAAESYLADLPTEF